MIYKSQAYKDHIIRKQDELIAQKQSNLKRAITKHERNPGNFTKANIRNAEAVLAYAKEQKARFLEIPVTP